jgi:hypothetical protein
VTRRYAELSAAFIGVNESCPTLVDGLTDVLRGLQQESISSVSFSAEKVYKQISKNRGKNIVRNYREHLLIGQ